MKVLSVDQPIKRNFGQARLGVLSPWIAPAVLMPLAAMGPNAGLALYACLVLGISTMLLRRPGEPPILLFIFIFQWIEAAVGPLYGNLLDIPFEELTDYRGQHQTAEFLMLTGLLVLAAAARYGAGPGIRGLVPVVRAFVAARPIRFWLMLFVGAWIFSAACTYSGNVISGLSQPLLTLSNLHWVAFVLLTLATFAVPGRPKGIWIAVFCFEFALSIGGFFSTFKDVFIYSLIGIGASNVRFTRGMILPGVVLVVIVLSLGIVWTAIKGEFRDYVNGGSGQQVVLVDYPDRLSELLRLVSKQNLDSLSQAADQMVRRLMYFEFFGAAMDHVPDSVPFAGGQIWGEAALRAVTPRILFPNKGAVNDSELTNYYTGLGVASYQQGTSISIGYMGEAYIDFGPLLMFAPIAILGWGLGQFYRRLIVRREAAMGVALAPFAILPAFDLGSSILKVIPSLGLSLIACWVVLRLIVPVLFGRSARDRRKQTQELPRGG